jgi:single-strand DNA-binding protein
MNTAIIAAIVTTDAEVRATESGSKVATFRVEVAAVDDRSQSHIMKVTCWSEKLIERVSGIAINQPVILRGRIDISTVESNQGFKDSYVNFVADDVLLVGDVVAMNSVTLVGRCGRDPEVKYFESGSVNAKISLAVNKGKDSANWFNLVAWGKTAEVMANYVTKGKQIAVTGSLFWETWKDSATGASRSKPVIRVQSVELLGGSRNESSGEELAA